MGSGVNVLNAPPITSLTQLASISTPTPGQDPGLSVERVAAAFLTSVERIYSFLESLVVRTETSSSHLRTRLHAKMSTVGITLDYGARFRLVHRYTA
jgi:hypothetical protein